MYVLKSEASFDSAHFLSGYNGKCANIHGHRWKIEVEICGGQLVADGDKRGMLIDFGDLKKEVRNLADSFDHALIYEAGSLKPDTVTALVSENFKLIGLPFRPTAENLAKHFFDLLNAGELPVKSVTVFETPENRAIYTEEV